MIQIKVCVGSSCYLKGAENVILYLEKVISELNISKTTELCGAFCLGNCGDGIAISINDEIKHITTPEEAEVIIKEYINKE